MTEHEIQAHTDIFTTLAAAAGVDTDELAVNSTILI